MRLPDKDTIINLDLDELRKAHNYRVGDKIIVRVGNSDSEPLEISAKTLEFLAESNHKEILEKLDFLLEIYLKTHNGAIELKNGLGKDYKAKINKYGAIKVNNQGVPDLEDPTLTIPITGYLLDNLGNFDARVNASLADPIDFVVSPDQDRDIYLNTISFLISDQNAILSNFGNIASLTNGMQLIYFNNDIGEIILADNLRSNFDIIRLWTDTPPISDNVSAFRADNISGNSEGYSAVLNFKNAFGIPTGIRLRAATYDKLILRVRDNTSLVDAFNCFYLGFYALD